MTPTSTKPRVFILTSRIYETAGGRTKATIERMMFLQKYFDTTLIEMSATKYPGMELAGVFAKYQTKFDVINPWQVGATGLLSEKNYLDYLRQRTGGLGDKKIFDGAQESFTLPTLSGGRIRSYVDTDTIVRLREYHPDGKVEFFALDDKQNIMLREIYSNGSVSARYYLDDSGKVCSGFTIENTGAKRFIYRTRKNTLIYSENITDHYVAFLSDIVSEGDVIISDVRYYDEILARLKPEIRKIHVWHEIATELPGQHGVNPAYETITNPEFPMSSSDKIVVFTDDAREEYAASFPHLTSNFVVIPYGTDMKPDVKNVDRNKDLVISIGRLTAQKNVAAQIKAFALFRKKHPAAKLNIFGDGSNRDMLLSLVDELGLSDAVKFGGFTHNSDKEFQHAGMMIFSSNYETFGLTILESLSNGTPVASYDVRFGAKTMINDRQNGIIAKNNSPESLADAMIKLHKTLPPPEHVRQSIKSKFSRENFEERWHAVIFNNTEINS